MEVWNNVLCGFEHKIVMCNETLTFTLKSGNCVHKLHLTRSPPFQELFFLLFTTNGLQYWQKSFKTSQTPSFFAQFPHFQQSRHKLPAKQQFFAVHMCLSPAEIMNSIENDDMICDDVLSYRKLPEGQFWIWTAEFVPIRNRKWWQLLV